MSKISDPVYLPQEFNDESKIFGYSEAQDAVYIFGGGNLLGVVSSNYGAEYKFIKMITTNGNIFDMCVLSGFKSEAYTLYRLNQKDRDALSILEFDYLTGQKFIPNKQIAVPESYKDYNLLGTVSYNDFNNQVYVTTGKFYQADEGQFSTILVFDGITKNYINAIRLDSTTSELFGHDKVISSRLDIIFFTYEVSSKQDAVYYIKTDEITKWDDKSTPCVINLPSISDNLPLFNIPGMVIDNINDILYVTCVYMATSAHKDPYDVKSIIYGIDIKNEFKIIKKTQLFDYTNLSNTIINTEKQVLYTVREPTQKDQTEGEHPMTLTTFNLETPPNSNIMEEVNSLSLPEGEILSMVYLTRQKRLGVITDLIVSDDENSQPAFYTIDKAEEK